MRPIHVTLVATTLAIAGCVGSSSSGGSASASPRWAGACGTPGEDRLDVSRAEFASKLATIQPGTSARTVLDRLGPPGDVRTEVDRGGICASRTEEVWAYGTHGHLSLGTLGTVHIQADGQVQYVFGGDVSPPAPALAEPELRRLLRLLDAVPSYNAGGSHDPLRLIQAVNALWPLGKELALAVISEYLRVSSWSESGAGQEGMFLVLRTLFEVPAGERHPDMLVGGPSPAEPDDPDALPRFPLALVDDIPVSVVSGYFLFGQAQAPEQHVSWYRERGVLRAAPLAPMAAPLEALARFATTAGPALLALPPPGPQQDRDRLPPSERTWFDQRIHAQAMLLLASVAPVSTTDDQDWTPAGNARRWTALRESVGGPVVWEPAASRYTRPDGSTLPTTRPALWPRVIWRPALSSGRVEALLERRDTTTVQLELRVTPTSAWRGRLEVADAAGCRLASLDLGVDLLTGRPVVARAEDDRGGTSMVTSFALKEGAMVRLALADVDLWSSDLKP